MPRPFVDGRHGPFAPRWPTRSARLVVATEQLVVSFGIPTTQFCRRRTSTRPALALLAGTSLPMPLNTPINAADRAVASLVFNPQGRQSRLSRRSTTMRSSWGMISTSARTPTPFSGVPGKGSWRDSATALPRGNERMAFRAALSE